MTDQPIAVVGLGDGGFTALCSEARKALLGAQLLVGGQAQIDAAAQAIGLSGRKTWVLSGGLSDAFDVIHAEAGAVCVLASGDPGFFGVVRPLAKRFGHQRLQVHPAVSSVSLAFARLGIHWDDALVVSAHGRPLETAARQVARARKSAVFTSPESPPQSLGRALSSLGCQNTRAWVCSHLGTEEESVVGVDLEGLAKGTWEPRSVVVVMVGSPTSKQPSLAWGLPDHDYDHDGEMITKSEVRAVAIARLDLPPRGVLWDVGAGSGSVGVECARLAPSLRVIAVEQDPKRCQLISANASSHGSEVELVVGRAPAALACLPDPDRAFVGGGGLATLDAVLERLRPQGRVVATFASIDRALAARGRLGSLVQLSVARTVDLPDGGVRLQGQNPVWLTWGP